MNDSFGNITDIHGCHDLPNPLTPLAFLSPHLAFQTEFAGFVAASSLAVCFSIK